jgi:hypothetical protein
MWITMWETSGKTGDNQWTTVEQLKNTHRGPGEIPIGYTGAVYKI